MRFFDTAGPDEPDRHYAIDPVPRLDPPALAPPRNALDQTLTEGLARTADYAGRCGAEQAHLVIVGRRPAVPWDGKRGHRSEGAGGRVIEVWGGRSAPSARF